MTGQEEAAACLKGLDSLVASSQNPPAAPSWTAASQTGASLVPRPPSDSGGWRRHGQSGERPDGPASLALARSLQFLQVSVRCQIANKHPRTLTNGGSVRGSAASTLTFRFFGEFLSDRTANVAPVSRIDAPDMVHYGCHFHSRSYRRPVTTLRGVISAGPSRRVYGGGGTRRRRLHYGRRSSLIGPLADDDDQHTAHHRR